MVVPTPSSPTGDLSNRLGAAEGTITNHEARLIVAEASISSHGARITTLETAIPVGRTVVLGLSATYALNKSPAGSVNDVDFDTVDYTDDAVLYTVSAAGVLTVATAGVYAISAGLVMSAGASAIDALQMTVLRDGTTTLFIRRNLTPTPAGALAGENVCGTVLLAAGATLAVQVALTGVAGTDTILDHPACRLAVTKIR